MVFERQRGLESIQQVWENEGCWDLGGQKLGEGTAKAKSQGGKLLVRSISREVNWECMWFEEKNPSLARQGIEMDLSFFVSFNHYCFHKGIELNFRTWVSKASWTSRTEPEREPKVGKNMGVFLWGPFFLPIHISHSRTWTKSQYRTEDRNDGFSDKHVPLKFGVKTVKKHAM